MNYTILNLVLAGLVVLLSFLISFLPPKTISIITYFFSFKTFGIRKLKRRHSMTDTLGNVFLFISVIFCFVYPFIPYFTVIAGVWITFSYLAALSRVPRMSRVKSRKAKSFCTFFLSAIYGFGLIGSLGVFNHSELIYLSMQFAQDVMNGTAFSIMYPLTNAAIVAWLAQGLLMLITLYCFWSQFKFMRLENSFKARNLTTYTLRSLFFLILILFLSVGSSWGIRRVYQVQEASLVTACILPEEQNRQQIVAV